MIQKISYVGTFGCGKTTRAAEEFVRQKHMNPTQRVEFLREPVIDCPFEFNEETSLNSQYWLIGEQLRAELTLEARLPENGIIVTDCNVFSMIPYMAEARFYKEAEDAYNFLKHRAKSYTKIYLLDGDKFKYVYDDGFRSTDKDFRWNIDLRTKVLFQRLIDENYLDKEALTIYPLT